MYIEQIDTSKNNETLAGIVARVLDPRSCDSLIMNFAINFFTC